MVPLRRVRRPALVVKIRGKEYIGIPCDEFQVKTNDYVNVCRVLTHSKPWNVMCKWFFQMLLYYVRITEPIQWVDDYEFYNPHPYVRILFTPFRENRRSRRGKKESYTNDNSVPYKNKSKQEQRAMRRAQRNQQRRK